MLEKIKLATVEKGGYSEGVELVMELNTCEAWGRHQRTLGASSKRSKNRVREKETTKESR